MSPNARDTFAVVSRSVVFHLCSGAVVLLFLVFLPFIWAPLRFGWPVLRAFVFAQLWLLRVICGQRYKLDLAHVPDGAAIYAVRHEALWETLVLPVLLNNPVVFLKQEILAYPVAGAVARKLGYIGLDRGGSTDRVRAAFDEARDRASDGRGFLIFPNGTRDPAQRDRVQTGVAVLYRALGVPCVPIVLDSGGLWPYKSWIRRPGVITVRALPPIAPGLRTSDLLKRLQADLSEPA